jgi:DNA-3-methyladenine glycosylase II
MKKRQMQPPAVNNVSEENLPWLSSQLSAIDPHLRNALEVCGLPPLWSRRPGFSTLLQIILEQQVSLASAKACFDKLAARIGEITPQAVLELDDAEMKRIGFSRQKTSYARHLATSVLDGNLNLQELDTLSDSEVKSRLVKVKGIGEWTSDIYLLMALLRPDVMPKGDLALHTAWHRLSGQEKPNDTDFIKTAERWRPFRSVAARILWHFYLSTNQKTSIFASRANATC